MFIRIIIIIMIISLSTTESAIYSLSIVICLALFSSLGVYEHNQRASNISMMVIGLS